MKVKDALFNTSTNEIELSDTKKKMSKQKEERAWRDLMSDKKKYIQRRVQEEEAEKQARAYKKIEEEYPDPPF